MLLRLLREALWRRKGRSAVALLCVLAGLTLTVTLLSIVADISEKMSRELRSYGSNILLTPRSERVSVEIGGISYAPPGEASYIDEREMAKVKTIFWRNNILALAPFLAIPVTLEGERRTTVALTGTWFERELSLPKGSTISTGFAERVTLREGIAFRTGVRSGAPWWQVAGEWPQDESTHEALVGAALARREGLKTGDVMVVGWEGRQAWLRVVGVLTTGGLEEDQIIVPLPIAQGLLGRDWGVARVMVSAAVLPKEKLAPDIRNKKPEEMTPKEYEKWYCSPIVEAVAKQLEEVIPGSQAQPILQIAQAEGAFLIKLEGFLMLLTLGALVASALGVMATVNTSVMERRGEIGLMKALGAEDGQIAVLFLAEVGVIGLVGGAGGFGLGLLLARLLGERAFGGAIPTAPALLLVAVLLGLAVTLLGAGLPVRQIARQEPVALLKGR